ncbi:MAG: hypothetical protein ABR968_03365 [Bacteroidales bacterium]
MWSVLIIIISTLFETIDNSNVLTGIPFAVIGAPDVMIDLPFAAKGLPVDMLRAISVA